MATMTPLPISIKLDPKGPKPPDGRAGGNPTPPGQAGPPAPPLPPVPSTPSETTAAPDPGMTDVAQMTRDYINQTPDRVGDLTDVAGGKIRDAYKGVYKENAADSSRRGVYGTGVHASLDNRTTDEQLQALAQSATDITQRGREQAGQMISNLSQQEATRAGIQQQQQLIGLQQRAADRAAQQQMFEQQRALSEMYEDRQPRSYYDDTDPSTVKPTGGQGPAGSIRPGVQRPAEERGGRMRVAA